MQQRIQILKTSPNVGTCPLHNMEIIKACREIQCSSQRMLCEQCHPLHNSHQVQSIEDYTRQLIKKLRNNLPRSAQKQAPIRKTFENLHKEALQFQDELQQTINILKQINLRKISVINCILKFDENQLYDQLCQWGLRENWQALERIAQEIMEMCLDSDCADRIYKKWGEDIGKEIGKFRSDTEKVRDRALDMSSIFNYDKVVAEINRSSRMPSEIPKNLPPPQSIFNISGADKTQQQIIELLHQKPLSSYTSINIDRNNLSDSGLAMLLSEELTNLTTLILSNNLLQGTSLIILIRCKERLPKLKMLNMEGNFIQVDSELTKVQEIHNIWPQLQFKI